MYTYFQSAGYFKELKIITTTTHGCLDRVFDLKYDPTEGENLITRKFCQISFDSFGFKSIESAIRKDVGEW